MTDIKLQTEKGQSLFELVVSIAISALVIVAIVSLVTNSIRNATFSKNNALAVSYAQTTTEWLRTERDKDTAAFLARVSINRPAPTTYCFQSLAWDFASTCGSTQFITDTIFIRQGVFNVTTDPVTGKTIVESDISVTWNDSQGDHTVFNSTNFTDWRQR